MCEFADRIKTLIKTNKVDYVSFDHGKNNAIRVLLKKYDKQAFFVAESVNGVQALSNACEQLKNYDRKESSNV